MTGAEKIVEALRETADAMQTVAMLDLEGGSWLYRAGICRSAAMLLTAQSEDVGEPTPDMIHEGFTPGPWTLIDSPSAGLEIHAAVDLGREKQCHDESVPTGPVLRRLYEVSLKPSVRIGEDGRAHVMLAYEEWRQFPTVNFQEMQRANARLMADAPNLYAEVVALRASLTRHPTKEAEK
jgi:hypothetical protein